MTTGSAEKAPSEPRRRRRGILGWLTPILVAAGLCLAGFLIYRALTRYDLDGIITSVTSIPQGRLAMAGGFAAASYLCLTGFDALAVRYVGRPLPYRRVALASFVALSIGHNIGLAALSSGAIRYRFYSKLGLGAEEIAKLVLFCAITVGLGLMILGGAALLLRPDLAERITGLARPLVLALGTVCLVLSLVYLGFAAWLRRPLRFRRWSLEMPSLKLAIGQAIIGPLNFACVAGCLYQALAASSDVAYLGIAAIYVIANVSAIVSHVPGGLGVIESVVLLLLPERQVIGALIVFRVVYYLVPLVIGSLLFALVELTRRRKAATAHTAEDQPA